MVNIAKTSWVSANLKDMRDSILPVFFCGTFCIWLLVAGVSHDSYRDHFKVPLFNNDHFTDKYVTQKVPERWVWDLISQD